MWRSMCIVNNLLFVWCYVSASLVGLEGAYLERRRRTISPSYRLKPHIQSAFHLLTGLSEATTHVSSSSHSVSDFGRNSFVQRDVRGAALPSKNDGVRRRRPSGHNSLFAKARRLVTEESSTKCTVVNQYGITFGPPVVDPNVPPLIDLEESNPETIFSDLRKFIEDPRSKNAVIWNNIYRRSLPQRQALRSLRELMPESKARDCLNVTDGSNVDDIVDPTYEGYYCRSHVKAFFRYEPEFEYMRNGTEITPRRLEPPELKMPQDMPTTEGDRELPSVPLGWRIFAAIGLYHTATGVSDPAVLWSGFRLTDGDPMGRLASGLYHPYVGLRAFSGCGAVKPDNTLLYTKHPIEQGEKFRGRKGDMSSLTTEAPKQHEIINENLYPHRFAEGGVWPRKHFECVVSSMTASQALWARLSTRMLRATAKVHRMYKLRIRKNFKQQVFSARQRTTILGKSQPASDDPVETSVGVLYFLSAPTLHHAVDLVCSDPMARCNFYQQLLLFEVDDALKYRIFEKREPDKDNPRQYVVLGSYDDRYDPEILRDKMMRFIVRSNCVNTHLLLHGPRKDAMVDLSMPVQQFLPITTKQRDRLLDKLNNVRDACNTKNKSPPVADLTIINQFDTDDALDWARRSPYTRSGCYKSLFVAKAYEIGFYGRSCKYIAPLPMAKALVPVRQEYAIVEFDPVDALRKRMSDGNGHFMSLPRELPRPSELYSNISSNESLGMSGGADSSEKKKVDEPLTPSKDEKEKDSPPTWPQRLLITIRRTVSECFKASNISARYAAMTRRRVSKQAHLGAVPFRDDGSLAVDVALPWPGCPRKIVTNRLSTGTTHDMPSQPQRDCLYSARQEGALEDLGDAQTLPNVLLSTEAIRKLLGENAPVELDTPFYADLLKDYIYISLPAGDFFECIPPHDNKRYNAMERDNETNLPTTAEDMNRLPENKPVAVGGYWMKKSDCHMLYKNDDERCLLFGKAPYRLDRRRELSADMISGALIKNEMILDYLRKGAGLTWPDLSNAYTRRGGKLVSHLTPSEAMKTMWTVPPLNDPYAEYTIHDEVPAARFYEKGVRYPPDDPRYQMAQKPRELYMMTLEHLQKVDRGEARAEDEPVKKMLETDHLGTTKSNDSISKWEEPDINLLDINEVHDAGEVRRG
ncbi:uncharacterized protein BXIN_1217 [Babesia sp. Xinjiang]|uniref:uncharacterized protein n=1 Tax=Babesia sp. Xinjiang TaxID=462227 RepID=UPI000A222479|nr:uncharacterized protein BXIN_1217 [Babesia sp. Xinjiang]ORM40081.1 hypothetical protein BXIN_1217 [Babesia sp. Xinjiang]